MNDAIINSSGNVFIDLGYSPDEAAVFQIRAALRKIVKARGLMQARAAEILGISQIQGFGLGQRQMG